MEKPPTILINGEARTLERPDATITDLIEALGLTGRPCAVEVNAAVIPKREHDTTPLRDGDKIELVTLVGGG